MKERKKKRKKERKKERKVGRKGLRLYGKKERKKD